MASEPPGLPAPGSAGGHFLRRLVKRPECKREALTHARSSGPKAAPPPSLRPRRAEPPLPPGSEVSRQIVPPAKWSPEGGLGHDVMRPAANRLRGPVPGGGARGRRAAQSLAAGPRPANRGAAAAASERRVLFFPRNSAAERGGSCVPGSGKCGQGEVRPAGLGAGAGEGEYAGVRT